PAGQGDRACPFHSRLCRHWQCASGQGVRHPPGRQRQGRGGGRAAADVREAARQYGDRGLQLQPRLTDRQGAEPRGPYGTMKSAVILLPGLNRDRDMIAALTKISGRAPVTVWQTETEIPDVDLIVIPGGFSYGDYLRCGAIAARMPVMQAIREKADKGVRVLGVCNGFQILVEAGMLPGALMRNSSLKFVCREVKLEVVNNETSFT